MRSLYSAPLICALLTTLACSSSETTDTGVNTTPDAGFPDTGVAVDAGFADAGFPDTGIIEGDGNDSFDQAMDIGLDVRAGHRDVLATAGDRDYYSFEGTAGTFVRVYTTSYLTNSGDRIDTVIRLFDAERNQVAENDDSLPRVNVNSEIIYRLPADGRYYIEVLEWSDWAGETPKGDPMFTYTVFALTVDGASAGTTVETEAGNDAASAIAAEFSGTAGLICGSFADANDVDVFRIQVGPDGVGGHLQFEIMPGGTDGYGSTNTVGQAWLTDATGVNLIARVTLDAEGGTFGPATDPGEFLLFVKHPAGAAGANDFYVIKFFVAGENDPEVEPNDTFETAEPRALVTRAEQMDRANFVLAHLPDGDEDNFRITPTLSETVTVVCGSRAMGSGIEGLTVTLLDGAGVEVVSATETDTALATIEDEVATSTVMVVRLSKTGQSAELSADFVRCGLFANPQ
ncbi:MAG: PPC domain-containing protein [Myxococcales bacterium]|nr:PPC domain-containing protein [Myxococcales bacterium]